MPTWLSLVRFLLAVTPLVMTPGAGFTLVSAKGVSGDRRGAFQIVLGTGLGILTHAVLAGLGLAALVMQSAQAYAVVRLVGAAYLVGLGVWLLAKALLHREPDPTPGRQGRRPRHARNPLAAAYLANVLNVKAAAVYLTLAPQFLPASDASVVGMMPLALVHVAVMAAWLSVWAVGLTSLHRVFDISALRRWAEGVGGTALIALGVRSAVPHA